jgi:hypothetical protein
MTTAQTANRVAAALLLTTGLSYWVAEHGGNTPLGVGGIAALFVLAVAKGWLVIDVFMGLRQAPRLWRRLLLGWLLTVCLVLASIGWATSL